MKLVYLGIVLSPLIGALACGLFGHWLSRTVAHRAAIAGVAVSFLLSLVVFNHHVIDGAPAWEGSVYTWLVSEGVKFEIGFLIDRLTTLMLCVVTFVSLMVHVYTIGYMAEDPGYKRFFSYIALFTFSMLMLVMSNNFLQLFFGWEAVGLVSYLLIGFWYTRESAIAANLKAFLVNRVGDFGFLLGIALIWTHFHTLEYREVFALAPDMTTKIIEAAPGVEWELMTAICILLFVGAMGKSAQMPLHVWLPDSMEGPTPISALIHAATMVTAGIFMVARMSPLFELSEVARSTVLVIGTLTAFLTGLLGIVQNDIKRVVAYSTLSQLGYMTAALGASAYAAGIFHLMTHAFFKALLFLGAGSVIIAMHHDQDIRNMGGLRRYMPWTWLCSLVGSLALIGVPGFSGFFSKDAIIEAVHHAQIPGAAFAAPLLYAGVFVTAFYSFRMYFLVFHGKERMDEHTREHLHETPAVVTVPLVLLAIPSVVIGLPAVGPLLFGGWFGGAIHVAPENDVLAHLGESFHGAWAMVMHGISQPPFWLAMGGVASAWFLYLVRPDIPERLRQGLSLPYRILERKYGFDDFNEKVLAAGGRLLGKALWRGGDAALIDGVVINGGSALIGRVAAIVRQVQTGHLYDYAFAVILGLLGLMTWVVFGG